MAGNLQVGWQAGRQVDGWKSTGRLAGREAGRLMAGNLQAGWLAGRQIDGWESAGRQAEAGRQAG